MRKLALIVFLLLACLPAFSQAPVIFFTDLDSGPNTGNSDTTFSTGNGVYVTVYGNFFGTSQGASTITWNGQNCLTVLPTTGAYTGWGMAFLWYQKIIVQINSTCTAGTGQFVVTVAGQSSVCANTPLDCNFTVRAIGTNHIYFAKTTGNNTAAGTFTAPLLDVQGCKNKVAAGDVCYLGGGIFQNNGDNFGAIVDVEAGGSTGLPMAIGAYPGATPQPEVGCTSGQTGCAFSGTMQYGIRIPDTGVNAGFWTWFGILVHIESGSIGMHVNGTSEFWRVIANHIQCPNFQDVSGCFATNMGSLGVGHEKFFGNETDSTGAGCCKESHSTYFSTDTSHVWVAFNYWHGNTTCHDLQFHSSPVGGSSGQDQFDLHVYDNKDFGNACDFLNFATVDPSKGTIEAFNNLVWHSGLNPPTDASGGGGFDCMESAGILNAGSAGSGGIQIYNNSYYDCDVSRGQNSGANPNWGAMLNTNQGAGTNINWIVHNGIADETDSERYIGGSGWSINMSGSNNDWFGVGTPPSGFTTNSNVDPLYNSPGTTTGADFHLHATSPMIGSGVTTWTGGSAPTFDLDGRVRPTPPSIGAFEVASGTIPSPAVAPAPSAFAKLEHKKTKVNLASCFQRGEFSSYYCASAVTSSLRR